MVGVVLYSPCTHFARIAGCGSTYIRETCPAILHFLVSQPCLAHARLDSMFKGGDYEVHSPRHLLLIILLFAIILLFVIILFYVLISFSIRVMGYPVPDIDWLKDGLSIISNPDYRTSLENGVCKLAIEETFAEDSALFTCKATNLVGTAETSASLQVKGLYPISKDILLF